MRENMKKVARKVKRLVRRALFWLRYLAAHEIVEIAPEEARAFLWEIAPAPESSAISHHPVGPKEFDLTIVVPAFNAEKWIEQCLDSILSQKTHYYYIVEVIDDGSTDRTAELVDRYQENEHIHVTHQQNQGYSGARNTALKRLRSDYVMFVDSDDYLLPGAIELLLDKGYEDHADIVEGNGFRFDDKGRLGKIKQENRDGGHSIWGGPCLKIIGSRLLVDLIFPEGYLYEDTIIGSLVVPRAKKVVIVPDEVYAYRIHPNSITQKHTADLNRLHSYWIMELMHRDMNELGIPIDDERYCATMKHIVFTYRRTILLPEEIKRSLFAATCGFVETTYAEYLGKQDRFALLARALVARDYGKYSVYCEADID